MPKKESVEALATRTLGAAPFLLVLLCSSCVPFGDCWPEIMPAVRVDPNIQGQSSHELILAGAVQINEGDVTVDDQGVPDPDRLTPVGSGSKRGYPYPTWFVAFLDSNGNRRLDRGEAFGVDPRNPVPLTCKPYTAAITIDRIRR